MFEHFSRSFQDFSGKILSEFQKKKLKNSKPEYAVLYST
jgi:hypothetical protein